MSSEQVTAHDESERVARWLKTRNAELENSNQLLLSELAQCRRIELTLREMAAYYSGLMSSSFLGIMFARRDGTIIDANDAFLRMLGYSRQDISEGKLCWQHICPSGEAVGKWRRGDVWGPGEFRFLRKDGQWVKLLFAAEFATGWQKIIGFTQPLAP
ncbi:MAG: PAS domain-containing protein [Acidobacteriota bacterium]|nr:PAS domain-containing protein [Acidobacteriota bacterium]